METNYNMIIYFTYKVDGYNYYFTTDKKLFNFDTKRFSKKVVRGYSVGYNLNANFITLKNLRHLLIKVKKLSKNQHVK